jgi:hypothetical protein
MPASSARRAGELFLGFGRGYIEAAFGVVDLKAATKKARKYAHLDDESLDWEPSDIDIENIGYHDPGHDQLAARPAAAATRRTPTW